jgi:phage recombination protein Bet
MAKKTPKKKKAIVPAKEVIVSTVLSEEDKQAVEGLRQAIVKQKETTGMPMTRQQIDIIKSQFAKGATDDELKMFLAVCSRTGLDPFRKQIYFIKRKNWDSKEGKYVEVGGIQTSIDGLRSIADSTGKYAGNDDPIFDDEVTPTKASVSVYKMVEGQRVPFTATARFDQYAPKNKDGELIGPMWKKMRHLMLGKCAEALALRKAFPAAMAGVYTTEEMTQATVQPTTEEVAKLDIEAGYKKLVSQLSKMNKAQLKEFEQKVLSSEKYSEEKKTEFKALVAAKLEEMEELKTITVE